MKLLAFRIQNFKSIIDSGWCNVSKDGVTCLIGQNESGKSSVLEALNSYGLYEIEADFVRSDGTTPVVSCSFEVEENVARALLSFIPDKKYVDRIVTVIKSQDWKMTKTAAASIDGELEFRQEKFDDSIDNIISVINEELKLAKEEADAKRLAAASKIAMLAQSLAALKVKDDEEQDEEEEEEEEKSDKVIQPTKPVVEPYIDANMLAQAFYKYQPSFVFFNDESNLLPNEMDIDDIIGSKPIDGKRAVLNLLKVGKIDIQKLRTGNSSTVKMYMNSVNKNITTKFQDFWTQKIGKGNKISVEIELKNRDASYKTSAGKPYLEFWVKDDEHILHPKQRSKGVRWFLSFYLSLKADSMENKNAKSMFLIDEPGANLHARAQEDVLSVFEDIRQTNQVFYSTHSQHLIEFKNLHRLLAIQRRDDSDESSETIIIPAYQLGTASTNTLAPILEHMGIDLSNQNVIAKKTT
ncbi:AAA family ATPase [Hymenobacter sp.]|uniref:AAA family ATPase n=1 Tax=Hymenobacter sp. TaxID=1898978 RepID=UPI00286CF4C5|nr:AAA family ATPase [Hymenobacter sp.]